MSPIGIFGGTFDPIHYGHLRSAFEMLQALRLSEVRFFPSGDPPHRGSTYATAQLRLEMVRAATAGQPGFVVDDREMRRDGPSYTIDTLISLREEHPDASLGLIVASFGFIASVVTKAVVSFLVGRLLVDQVASETQPGWWSDFISLAIGALIYGILRSIPVFGWVLSVIVTLAGLGAIFYLVFNRWLGPADNTDASLEVAAGS